MAQDQFGNYVCDLAPPPPGPASSTHCCAPPGHGPPYDDIGANGNTYEHQLDQHSGTVAASETPGALDAFDGFLNKTLCPLELYALAACRVS